MEVDYNYGFDYSSLDPTYLLVLTLVALALGILNIVGMWKIFKKAGVPGWGAIVPIYNAYLLFKISLGNGWLFLLMLVPLVNVVVLIIVYAKLAAAFGKGVGYTLGLIFLTSSFTPILGLGSAEYQKTA